MLKETVDALNVKPGGIYADLTSGRGGHSAELLSRLGEEGRLICFDRDPDAIRVLNERFGSDKRVTVVHDRFSNLRAQLDSMEIEAVDGILADLGVSSRQLDTPERGFSFHNDGAPLDMRMSQEGRTAADIVNTYSAQQLADIFFRYGEEKFSKRIAALIVKYREDKPIQTAGELVEIIKEGIPAAARRTGGHPARRVFQALRIETNGELDELNGTLEEMFDSLKQCGRISILTFHSLEDRAVKQFFASMCKGCDCPPSAPICTCGKKPRGRLVFKSITACQQELEENPRSHSARLRCIEKL
ncbi:MAG: 16S rRNA (cytosine(1402)-N(4))-methyltransferase RsmH [Clostridia bacterium]|nr:16S rRNA (cytosine(1402)-N(4))-methyltransferase RsmH [Clostridia bacterium]